MTPTSEPTPPAAVIDPYQTSVAAYWNRERSPVNRLLGEVDGIHHHHFGIGEVDWDVLDGPDDVRERRVVGELHRLECAQADLLVEHLGPIGPNDRILDSGCGRGGGSLVAHDRFGCHVAGITISEAQVAFAAARAAERGVADKVVFHLKNMLDTGFASGSFRAIWNNESTMYVELSVLFAEYARLLSHGGRYVCVTGCRNDVYGLSSREVSTINAHYICEIHSRRAYFAAMAANRLVPATVIDLTDAAIPYWELRAKSHLATGIEKAFLTAYRDRSLQYLLIVADRV
ncbi:geranyl diphosphate 2-C-methyltransferase [Embleya sp. AB8]|uniref:geranyl diphosphate 2-C-methyltransferase n=1 Tax=Embleya sp. AB8 TaxID=3156304 RepID=UPI003C71F084